MRCAVGARVLRARRGVASFRPSWQRSRTSASVQASGRTPEPKRVSPLEATRHRSTSREQNLVVGITTTNDVRQVRLHSLMRHIAVPQGQHFAMHERHGLVVGHQHAPLTSGSAHLSGTSPGVTGIAPEPPGLGCDDEVTLGRMIYLSFLHQLREGVVDQFAARSLHGWERVPESGSERVQSRRLPLRR